MFNKITREEADDGELICAICQDTMEKPVRMACCSTPLCYECLNSFMQKGDTSRCPFDRRKITRHLFKNSLENVDYRLWDRCKVFKQKMQLSSQIAGIASEEGMGIHWTKRLPKRQEMEVGELKKHLDTWQAKAQQERQKLLMQEEQATLEALSREQEVADVLKESQRALEQIELQKACQSDEDFARKLQQQLSQVKEESPASKQERAERERADEEFARRIEEKLKRAANGISATPKINQFFSPKPSSSQRCLSIETPISTTKKRSREVDLPPTVGTPVSFDSDEDLDFVKKTLPQTKFMQTSFSLPDEDGNQYFPLKDWNCASCTYLNHKLLSECEMCGAMRNKTITQNSKQQAAAPEDDKCFDMAPDIHCYVIKPVG